MIVYSLILFNFYICSSIIFESLLIFLFNLSIFSLYLRIFGSIKVDSIYLSTPFIFEIVSFFTYFTLKLLIDFISNLNHSPTIIFVIF